MIRANYGVQEKWMLDSCFNDHEICEKCTTYRLSEGVEGSSRGDWVGENGNKHTVTMPLCLCAHAHTSNYGSNRQNMMK